MLFSVVPTHVSYYYNYIRDQQQHHDVLIQRDVRRSQNGFVVNSSNFNNGTIWPNNRRAVKVFYNFKNFPLNGDRLHTVSLVFPPTQKRRHRRVCERHRRKICPNYFYFLRIPFLFLLRLIIITSVRHASYKNMVTVRNDWNGIINMPCVCVCVFSAFPCKIRNYAWHRCIMMTDGYRSRWSVSYK